MRHVTKCAEPDWYRDFKRENRGLNWNVFSRNHAPNKKRLVKELLQEQHFLCGYCGKRIDENESHIEHVIPRSKLREFRKNDLSYDNLLASCPADSYEEGVDTCGHAKGSWYEPNLFVSPHDSACETYFTYSELGQIMPSSPDTFTIEHRKAATTIERLALDTYALSEARRGAIEGLLGDDPYSLSAEEKQALLQIIDLPDDQGQLRAYCFVVKRILEQL